MSLLYVWLTCMGFGASMSLESFGADPFQLIDGPFDLLRLSAYPVMQLVLNVMDTVFDPLSSTTQLYKLTMAIIALLVLITLLLAAGEHSAAIGRMGRRVAGAAGRARRTLISPPFLQWWRMPAITLGTAASVWVIARVSIFLCTAGLILLLSPFWAGYSLTKDYFYDVVVAPPDCRPLWNAAARRWQHAEENLVVLDRPSKRRPSAQGASKYPHAVCVRVELKDRPGAAGRLILATTDAVMLFDPKTGGVTTLPRKDAIISLVREL